MPSAILMYVYVSMPVYYQVYILLSIIAGEPGGQVTRSWNRFTGGPRYLSRTVVDSGGAPHGDVCVVPTIFLLFSPYLLIGRSVFVAVQGSCTYAGTKLCLNDHYLCETFSLGWTIHHCNATPMWGLISLLVLIEHLSQLAWMPTYGTAIRDFRHQRAVYLESLL